MPLGMEVDLGTGHIVIDGFALRSAPQKGHNTPCLLWPRLPISATAELLYQFTSKSKSIYKFEFEQFDVEIPAISGNRTATAYDATKHEQRQRR